MRDIDGTVEAGLFGGWTWIGDDDPRHRFTATAEFLYDVGDTHDGYLISAGVRYFQPVTLPLADDAAAACTPNTVIQREGDESPTVLRPRDGQAVDERGFLRSASAATMMVSWRGVKIGWSRKFGRHAPIGSVPVHRKRMSIEVPLTKSR